MRIDVLALPRYSPSGASSRVRMYQFAPGLSQAGIDLRFEPLLQDSYLRRLYASGSRSRAELAASYARRMMLLVAAGRHGLVWLEKELWPFAPAFIERFALGRRVPWIVDLDDAVFHNYDLAASGSVRRVLGRKIDDVMTAATAVIAGNEYIAERARRVGARSVVIVPSVVDVNRYVVTDLYAHGGSPAIGWIGSPATQHLLEPVIPVLARLAASRAARFVTIGGRYAAPLFPGHEALDWTAAAEADQLAALDVGIMPLPDTPFERGKCGYKLIQYMAAGLPVVASPVGANRQIVLPDEAGLLATSPEEWQAALERLLDDVDLRARFGSLGRERAVSTYSLEAAIPAIERLMRQVVDGASR